MDRKRVFRLLMAGRITEAEAERLIAAWQTNRESMWIVGSCLAIALAVQLKVADMLPTAVSLAHTLRTAGWVHGAAAMLMQFPGGAR